MSFSPNREELAWAAGLFDGEGHVGATPRLGSKWLRAQVTITQVDRRVLDRFAAAVGLGKVYGPYAARGRVHPQHSYKAAYHARVQAIGAMLWRWLSPVKREQFSLVLTTPLRRPFCSHHAIPSHCRECLRGPQKERMRRFRLRKKELA